MARKKWYCNECHSNKRMVEVKIPVPSKLRRAMGFLVVAISLIFILIALLFYFSSFFEYFRKDDNPFAILIYELDWAYIIYFSFFSIVGALVGYLLLKKKKAYKCIQCGHVEPFNKFKF